MNVRKFWGMGAIKLGALALAMGLVACGDDSSSGSDDSSSTPVESEIDLAGGKKVTCDEKMEGVVAALANGDFRRCEDGAWIKISREEALEADEILGYKGDESSSSVKAGSSSSAKVASSSSVKATSSSSGKVASSSSAKVVGSSSSGKPAVDSDLVPEIYECPDGSFVENEEDCPSAGSSSSDKPVWQYLNPDIEYGEFTDDRDGQVYKTVTIGEGDKAQTWMAENLNYNSNTEEVTNRWCGGGKNGAVTGGDCFLYGRVYTWSAAVDACPNGWHLPKHYEFEVLINNVDPTFVFDDHPSDASSSTAGQFLKSMLGWKDRDDETSGNGLNTSGFSAIPAGLRSSGGQFYYVGEYANFWSSDEYYQNDAFGLRLYYGHEDAKLLWENKNVAKSVRCIQNSLEQGGPI